MTSADLEAERIKYYSNRKYRIFYLSFFYCISLVLLLFTFYKIDLILPIEAVFLYIGMYIAPLLTYTFLFFKEVNISSGKKNSSFHGKRH